MSYHLSNKAGEDLRKIARYTVRNFGTRQAKVYALGFQNCFEAVSDNPHIGQSYDHIRLGLRRFDHQSHSIYYMVRENGVLIVRILHQSRDTKQQI